MLPVIARKFPCGIIMLTAERFDAPKGTDAYYEPNSFNGPVQDARFAEPPLKFPATRPLQSPRRQRRLHAARRFVPVMTAEQQQRLFKNIAAAMAGVPEEIVQRQLFHFHKADPRYADGVAKALGLNPDATGK